MKRLALLLPLLALFALAANAAASDGASSAASPAGELLGADELVGSFAAALPEPAAPTDDPRDLIDEIEALRADGPARRDPDLRAARWLGLAERAEAFGFSDPLDPDPDHVWMHARALPTVVMHLVAALPPPSRWPAMREALDARAAAADPTNQPPALSALRLSLARLSGDAAASSNALRALRVAPGAAHGPEYKALRKAVFGRDRLRRPRANGAVRFSALLPSDPDETPAEAFARRLAACDQWSGGAEDAIVTDEDLELPDETLATLVSSRNIPWMLGTAAVRARYRAIVRAAGTNAPATAVAWSFADTTPDGLAYFAERAAARGAPDAWAERFARLAALGPDALLSEGWASFQEIRHFGGQRKTVQSAPEPDAYLRAVATLCGRDLAAGRVADADARLDAALPEALRPAVALAAASLAFRSGDPFFRSFRSPADPAAIADFVERRALPPAAPATEKALEVFLYAAPPADDASAARLDALAERLGSAPDADPRLLTALDRGRLAAALAAARFDDAAAAARRLAERPPAERRACAGRTGSDPLLDYAGAMLAAGETNRFDEALALLRAGEAADGADGADEDLSESSSAELAELLARAGRAAEAQALYAENVRALVRKLGETPDGLPVRRGYGSHWSIVENLGALAALYLEAGRPADALALFERVPFWGVADAAGLRGFRDAPRLLALALDGAGRTDDAVRVARHAVEVADGYRRDWPWELLLERLPAEEFLALADRLHALVPWEERPVQWKAEALRRAGRLEEAEEAARLALKIDPTDGETPPGDRIRSYAILASVLEAKGGADAAKEAATLRSVVAAVRLAEKGDELTEAGLVSLALEAYDAAAALFEDAYCVQWRLAERLRERGRPDLAAEHYEETFRRMPEQFGRVASLCFGCAGVFESGESLAAAERILPDLAARPGALPATHRLLGMLRAEQGRLPEAWDAFRAALDADPDYLDALSDLLALRGRIERPRAEWADLQRRAFELDPLGLRLRIEPGDILDWKAAREANAAARALLPDAPASVLPLPASAEALAAGPDPRRDVWRYQRVDMARFEGETLAGSSFDAAAAFAAMDDPPTWFVALRRWLETCGSPAARGKKR
ncbi:MAG: tetratricopeptide repeat protein, partial [Kiritimatiellae bacterium]|nr:tetratricopeptide repeat protein [Kiritimatiellia bacterium]